MPFIIDGYNLMHSIGNLDEDWETVGDVRLCHIVGRYLKLTGEKGEIVFDGTGPPEKSRFENISGLEVIFSGLSSDADTVIENKIGASSAPKGLTVVSSDRRLRKAARVRKAKREKSEEFWDKVTRRLSRRKKRIKEPSAKRLGLTESETEQWLKYFGIEQ